jgi:hypothetical protein
MATSNMGKVQNFHSSYSPFISYSHPPHGLTCTPEAKYETLKDPFFQPILAADLSDIPGYTYPPEKLSPSAITAAVIASVFS